MKRILLALTMVGLLLPFAPRAQAETEVSLNLFYDNLSSQGNWIEVADYGYCFQPNVAVSNQDWRPYADGYWAYTDLGWTWVSYEDFGWATYHYGRWASLDSYGWVWVPGYEWGPAWVSWRTGGDYVGWAPLPPQRGEVVYEGRSLTGDVDVTFGIGPLYYNFVDIRYIGEPVLRSRILPSARNVTVINNTVNVTNITYNNSVVYNYGPDYNRLNQYSTRPVQRLTIQRETTMGGNLAQGRKGNFNRVSGNQLTVMAPTIQKSQQRIAPKQVKAKVEKPTVETGWKGINNRQQVEAEMKKGDPKNIKTPDFQPQKGRKREAVAGADQSANQNAAGQPQEAAQSAPAAGQQAQEGQQAQQQQREQKQQEREQARQQREQNQQQREQAQQAEQGDQAAQQAEAQKNRQEKRQNRRGQAGENRENAAPDAAQQESAQQSEQADQIDGQKADRQKRAEERRAQRAEQNGEDQSKPEQSADRQRNPKKAAPAGENQPSDNTPSEGNKSRREQRAERAQPAPSADDNAGARSRAEQQPNRPERAPRQMQERRSQQQEQARPQQRQERQEQQQGSSPNEERKGKKKKPNDDEQPPQS